jgi:S1-C subfamily serine protease
VLTCITQMEIAQLKHGASVGGILLQDGMLHLQLVAGGIASRTAMLRTLLLFVLLVSAGAFETRAQDRSIQLPDGWVGDVFLKPNREFDYCRVSRFAPQGLSIAIIADAAGLRISAHNADWKLRASSASAASLAADRTLLALSGRAGKNAKYLHFAPRNAAEAMIEVAAAARLVVNVDGTTVEADMAGSRRAMLFLSECIQQHAASTKTEYSGGSSQKPSTTRVRTGTGFFVTAEGHILTNAHVVKGCPAVDVAPEANGVAAVAVVLAADEKIDLAVLQAPTLRPSPVARLKSGVRLGEGVFVFGFPLTEFLAASGNFTAGNVTAEAGVRDDPRHVQISAPVQQGNSGGPVLDQVGNVVAVVVSKADSLAIASRIGDIPQNINFAIKADVARGFLMGQNIVVQPASAGGIVQDPADIASHAKRLSVLIRCQPR